MGRVKFLQKCREKLPKLFFQTAVLLSYYHLIQEYFYELATCHGISMEPTLFNEDLLLIQKRDKYSIKRGDIVVARNPKLPTQYICKRVVWLSGDFVYSDVYSGKVPRGFIWLQGDNIFNSIDSRHFGPIPKGLIMGKAEYIVWPLFKDLKT